MYNDKDKFFPFPKRLTVLYPYFICMTKRIMYEVYPNKQSRHIINENKIFQNWAILVASFPAVTGNATPLARQESNRRLSLIELPNSFLLLRIFHAHSYLYWISVTPHYPP